MEEHNIIGTAVVIAILLIAVFGIFLVVKQGPGKAIKTLDHEYLGYSCSCLKEGKTIKPFYTLKDFVILNGEKISISKTKNTKNPCPEVCGALGGYAKY